MKPISAIAVALFVWSSAFADSSAPSADELLRQTDGADIVLRRLWYSDPVSSKFSEVCDRIESGESAWLQVAQQLKPASDAGASEMLNESVARALQTAPIPVLRLIKASFALKIADHGFSLYICTSPFIDDGPEVVERYQRRAIEALRKPVPSELEQVRNECLEKLRASLHRKSH